MPLDSLSPQQWAFVVILVSAIALLVTERLRTDVIALLIILALYLTHVLDPEQALAGFHSEPAIVIAAMFVLSAGFQRTGLSDLLGRRIAQLAGRGLTRMLAVIMPTVALLSACTHHVTITAIMLPITLHLSEERKVPASKLLMPMAIASSLGTCITILGAPSFLVSSELLRQAGRPGLNVLSIAPIGIALTIAGTLYMLLVGRFLLPTRSGAKDTDQRFRLDDYFTEVQLLPDSPLVGKTIEEVEATPDPAFAVRGWVRDGRRLPHLRSDQTLRAGDLLLVQTTPETLVAIRDEPGMELKPVLEYEPIAPGDGLNSADEDLDVLLTQAIVAPRSSLVGRTLSQINFRARYGAVVLGVWRKNAFLAQELAHTPLREGDVLVLQGDEDALARVEADPSFLMLVPFHAQPRRPRKMILAAAVMVGTVLAAALDWLTLGMAALGGALAMVLTRCLTPRQAYRAIDVPMFVFVAGAIPLGIAMRSSGTADLLAGWLQGMIGTWPQTLVLLALFATVGLVVQIMGSDAATVALFAPVAIALAQLLGHPPEGYVITVAMAAVTAILTPMSHHNLLIYHPGGYRFFDYTRVGAPLTVVLAVIVAVLAPMLWG